MAATIRVTLNRLPELAASLPSVQDRALQAGTQECVAVAFTHARVDTGMMRSNTTIEIGGGNARVTWNQSYSAYNEFGTYKMSAQPFARPGAEAAIPAMQAELAGWP